MISRNDIGAQPPPNPKVQHTIKKLGPSIGRRRAQKECPSANAATRPNARSVVGRYGAQESGPHLYAHAFAKHALLLRAGCVSAVSPIRQRAGRDTQREQRVLGAENRASDDMGAVTSR